MDTRSSAFATVSDRLLRLADSAVVASVDPEPLLSLLSHADLRTLVDANVGIDDQSQSLTVQLRWPEDDLASERFFDFHAINFTVQSDRVQPVLELYPGDPLMDVSVGPGAALGCALHVPGSRPYEEDIEAIIEVARTDRIRRDAMLMVCAPLAALTGGHADGLADQVIGDGRSRWFIRFVLTNDSPTEMAATMQAIRDAASQLAVSETQLDTFMRVHPALAVRRSLIASLSLTDGQRDQCVGLEYAPVSWDATRSLMRSFHGAAAARRVSALARITGAKRAAMVRIELRHVDPPRMHVWAQLLPEAR